MKLVAADLMIDEGAPHPSATHSKQLFRAVQ
jgi:hypothetical protein